MESNEKWSTSPPQKENVLLIAVILLTGVFMSILDTSIVNVSTPKMMAVFGVTTTQIQWVITAYSLVVGALVPVTGYLSERFGSRNIFLIALVLFTIGSTLCGAAWSSESLIVFRILQAIGGGAVMPTAMSMFYTLFPPEKRGLSMGLFGIGIMLAPAIGPTLGGYLTEAFSWRLIFYINVPIGILAVILGMLVLKQKTPLIKRPFDIPGFLFSSIGFATLLYGLGIIADKGWNSTEVIAYLTIAIITLTIFVVIELVTEYPMIDLRLLKNPIFAISTCITIIVSMVLMGSLFIIPIFLETVMGLSALHTGLILLPQALLTGVVMPIAGNLFDRFGARWLAVIGLLFVTLANYLTHFLALETSYFTIIFWLCIRSFGLGLAMMPIQAAGMSAVKDEKIPQATAINNTVRQVSGAFGVAILTLLFQQRQIFHQQIMTSDMNMFSPSIQQGMQQLQSVFVQMGQSVTQAKQSALSYVYNQLSIHATVRGMDDIFIAVVWLSLLGVLAAIFLPQGKQNKREKVTMVE